jgi:16S rRNA (cytosine1402-N4)-methyltransferase
LELIQGRARAKGKPKTKIMKYFHEPVLSREVIEYLSPKSNKNYVDCTLGLAGHSKKILEKNGPKGQLVGIEQNTEGLSEAQKRLVGFESRIKLTRGNFSNLEKIIKDSKISSIDGFLFDLGLASWQINDRKSGISFSEDAELDMRLSPESNLTATDIINTYPEKQLANLLFEFGDIRGNRYFAKKIVGERKNKKIQRTSELVKIIGTSNPKVLAPIFQALRIEVNNELENLLLALPQALSILDKGGKIVVISYHSGEDRIVKNFFRSNKNKIKILTKKPITASFEEIKNNSRARSAKLRAAEKI